MWYQNNLKKLLDFSWLLTLIIPVSQRMREEDHHMSEATLIYIISSTLAWSEMKILRSPVNVKLSGILEPPSVITTFDF